jgi:hypothetical protein
MSCRGISVIAVGDKYERCQFHSAKALVSCRTFGIMCAFFVAAAAIAKYGL